MPISFNCESCKKKVKAPDGAGGKWGKCPKCGHRFVVKHPSESEEVLTDSDEFDARDEDLNSDSDAPSESRLR